MNFPFEAMRFLHIRKMVGSLFGYRPLSVIPSLRSRSSQISCRFGSDGTAQVTPRDVVQHWQRMFEANGIPEARESSEYIVSFVLGAKTFQSFSAERLSGPVTDQQWREIQRLSTGRLKRMPVQYVIGEWDFGDMTLEMRPPVFIPRPETEELVKLIVGEFTCKQKSEELSHTQKQQALLPHCEGISRGILQCDCESLEVPHQTPVVLDIGCGSGAISLSLLQKIPQSRLISVDKGIAAVNLTWDNAVRLEFMDRIKVLHHNILTDPIEKFLPWAPVDAIVSNPPYVFEEDMQSLAPEILSYEDLDALCGGADGLMVIKAILLLTPQLLKDFGVFLEVDPRHPEMVQKWLSTCPDLRLHLIAIHEDFCGKPRFLHLRKRKASTDSCD
ncbi:MTRF1L release factor glutamine methyltransferase isoform X1 [Pleurodeles waltl]|uniref:MTRF1L release factor glutamine methyltransferase isoform X1 n=1 Tax=Pleurodeles waltl TaxID=8319 RepID=UPI00370939FF